MRLEFPPGISQQSQTAAISFLMRYDGATHRLYNESLRLFFEWTSTTLGIDPLSDVRRSHLDAYIRHLQTDRGNSASTVNVRLAPVVGMYRLAEIDGLIERTPAAYLMRPKMWRGYSDTMSLSMVELMLLLRTADRSPIVTDAALVQLMGGMGLRVSEACGVRIEDFAETVRGHRILHLVGKGGRPAVIPIPAQPLRALERAADGRAEGYVLIRPDWKRATAGQPFSRRTAALAITRLCHEAGIDKPLTPHGLRHSYVTAGLDMGISLRHMQIAARHADPRTTSRWIGTPTM